MRVFTTAWKVESQCEELEFEEGSYWVSATLKLCAVMSTAHNRRIERASCTATGTLICTTEAERDVDGVNDTSNSEPASRAETLDGMSSATAGAGAAAGGSAAGAGVTAGAVNISPSAAGANATAGAAATTGGGAGAGAEGAGAGAGAAERRSCPEHGTAWARPPKSW